jgi:predicted DCC family thiol-disulfide oxidoreductase YuxK
MPRRGSSMRPDGPTLIYDGACGMCRDAVRLLRRWDRDGTLRYVPFQDEAAVNRFGIPLPALAAAMHLVLPDGRVFAGADAAPEILRLLPGKRWLAGFYRLPGVRPVARRAYSWIAARRHCEVRGLPR